MRYDPDTRNLTIRNVPTALADDLTRFLTGHERGTDPDQVLAQLLRDGLTWQQDVYYDLTPAGLATLTAGGGS